MRIFLLENKESVLALSTKQCNFHSMHALLFFSFFWIFVN
jgi:hypothetical protein